MPTVLQNRSERREKKGDVLFIGPFLFVIKISPPIKKNSKK